MAFTPTLRRNGEHLVNVRIEFRLDGTRLARILAAWAYDDATDFGTDLEAQISRSKAEQQIRSYLSAYGWGEEDPLEEHEPDQVEVKFAWGADQVKRLWPSMTVRDY